MNLRVISPEGHFENEAMIIQALIDAGLKHYHCRKPKMNEAEFLAYLHTLPKACLAHLVYHNKNQQWHQDFGFEQLHGDYQSCQPGIIYSKSCHSMPEFNQAKGYHTAFLSPIFDSISKSNYPALPNLKQVLAQRSNFATQLCALGGVRQEDLTQLNDLGFQASALMGAIWQSPNPTKYFESCMKIVNSF